MKKTTLLKNMFILLSILFIKDVNAQEKKQKKIFGKEISSEKISPSGMIRCATDEHDEYLRQNNPKMQTKEQIEAIIQKQIQFQSVSSQSGGIIYIPVVVHVIHNGDAYGTNENITDEQVQSQITVMTQDYRRMVGTPGYNTNTVGADIQIEFVLAKVDPNGNPTNGIDRVNLCQASFTDTEIDSNVKPATIWDPTQYMNMWSVNFTAEDLLGYAQFPNNSTSSAIANTDGVVAGYGFFGSSSLASGSFSPPFDKGRTMTHEVGHFLGLLHTFQGGCPGVENNTTGDYCADTPAVASPNFGCSTTNSCPTGGNDMIQNYMDYTDDACMNIFTLEQKARIVAVMNSFPRRASLKTSTKDIAIPLFANDAEVKIENSCSSGTGTATCANPNPPASAKVVSLYNRGTSNLTSATLSYNIDGGTNYTNSWSGNLAPNKFVYITLPNTAVSGTLNVSVTSVNGGTNQRTSNNITSKSFVPTGLSNYNYTTFHMTLIKDNYGSETTWQIVNAAGGTPLYSSRQYTGNGSGTGTTVYNADWTLPADGCYIFTINDGAGDGICCDYGAGSYTITTNNGATVVATGGSFGSSESKYFSNNALGLDSFETLSDVYVYPNPTKGVLNIAVPNGIEADSVSVHNYLGQLISTKNISTVDDLSINTSSLSNGIYLITISKGNETKTLRFVKE